ncbi:DUF3455 domain-containing protein [Methylocystis sp. B8]|uniref:DUF3455 domain-containing protein n=1 Tax=Methylocystis sp. B8 TaxID=544938 RepID=UPI0010FF3A4A|nr:DUF3455 domain-containing protein [Methylocystis sp. B8]TLG71860.1 DUF3455 domain-containing protein [Methylocystis sp. B8]
MRKTICCLVVLLSVADTHAEELPTLPDPISVKGGIPLARVEGVGAQIYVCSKNAKGGLEWAFREPIAILIAGRNTIGRHYAGPVWEFADGSRVAGKLVAKVPGQSSQDVPWLKLAVVQQTTAGLAAGATWILRLNTKGGLLEGGCSTEGELHSVPYTATYLFGM